MHLLNTHGARLSPIGRETNLYTTLKGKPEIFPVCRIDAYMKVSMLENDRGKPIAPADCVNQSRNCDYLEFVLLKSACLEHVGPLSVANPFLSLELENKTLLSLPHQNSSYSPVL